MMINLAFRGLCARNAAMLVRRSNSASNITLSKLRHSLTVPFSISTARMSSDTKVNLRDAERNPHVYTAGRWLLDDSAQREARRIEFDFGLLCDKVLKCCNAASITSWYKKDGFANRTIVFSLSNKKQVVARLPTLKASLSPLMANSEAATVEYMQRHTTIPIPRILDWSDASSSDLGYAYTIQEHATGVSLNTVWHGLTEDQQMACIESVANLMAQVTELDFPAYGSLYFVDEDSSQLTDKYELRHDKDICIGPRCSFDFFAKAHHPYTHVPRLDSERGPWPDLCSFTKSIVFSGLGNVGREGSTWDSQKCLYQGPVKEHIHALYRAGDVLDIIVKDARVLKVATPTLKRQPLQWHNVFVDPENPTQVTGVVNWQASTVCPAFELHGSTAIHLPGKLESGNLDLSIQNRRSRVLSSPRLAAVEATDPRLLSLFFWCHNTWLNGSPILVEELIVTSNAWDELGLSAVCPCPYLVPSGNALDHHKQRFRYMVQSHKIMAFVDSHLGLDQDCWVSRDSWDGIEERLREAYKLVSSHEAGLDPELHLDSSPELWPYDLGHPE